MTLIPQPANVTQNNIDAYRDDWCVYAVSQWSDAQAATVCIYIGLCKMREVFLFSDARRNSIFVNMITANPAIECTILTMGERIECQNWRGQYLLNMPTRPICNARGYDTIGMSREIICNETGVRFRTQTECCAKMGLDQGRLSMHLSGKPSSRTVAGYTFRYVNKE